MSSNGKHHARLNELVDRHMYATEAMYHAQVETFRRWLTMTEYALRDEQVDAATTERVLNRLVYGTPDGADAHVRAEQERELIRAAMSTPLAPFYLPGPTRAGTVRPAQP